MRAVAAVFGGLLVVLGIGWMLMARHAEEAEGLRGERDAATGSQEELEQSNERLGREVATEKRRASRAQAEVAELRKELADVQERLTAATAPPPEPEREPVNSTASTTPEERTWREVVAEFPAYRPEGVAEALSDVPWETVADSLSHMPPLIRDLAVFIRDGKPLDQMPPETVADIQRYNSPLLLEAMKLTQKGVPGTRINGAFSHPGFMTNAIAATLAAREMPLTARQSDGLSRLADDYSAREAQRAAHYGDDAFALEKLIDESALKHDFFEEVYALLTAEQHAALRSEPARGRTQLDIFNEAVIWSGRVGPLVFDGREDLSQKVGEWVISRGGIPEDARDAAKTSVFTWVDGLPDDFLAWHPDGLVNAGMLQVEHVQDSAERVLALLRTLDRDITLDEATRKRLRAIPGTIVVYASSGG